ncbi:MAG: FAD-dependent oxidoreductase [Candidatus Aminicenantaceae bacterium]
MSSYRINLMICAGTGCVSNRSFQIREALELEIKKHNLEKEVLTVMTGCNGFCAAGPIMLVQPDGVFYQKIQEEDIPYLVEEHFLKGRPVKRLMYTPPAEAEPIPKMADISFFKKQILIALRNKGIIDPEKIDDYIARDGYAALSKVLTKMTPEETIEEIKKSGLRGRGGGGFPTGIKWEFARGAEGDEKFVICNADEGDPGAFMDRSIVEADPHSILEGMTIGAYTIGANKGYVYVRSEYPLAVERMLKAIDQSRDYGLLGKDILSSGFNFEIEVIKGAGVFVCGEETSLIASIEGKIGEPRPRPPYPAENGLWGKPTNINNVETWADVPAIINWGADWYSKIGTKTSKGTKVFSVAGKIKDAGLVEVPMGITLGELIFDIAGGIHSDRKFKAVLIGGPSGGALPSKCLNLPVDYESLIEAGAMMGSGGMVVADENNCMVEMARYFLNFTRDESCGKCTPCREGIPRMLEILTRIKEGKADMEDLTLLEDLARSTKDTALCGLGNTAPNPVLTTLRYFRDEYEAHIKYKRCTAAECKEVVSSPCHYACPISTDAASYVALIAHGKFKEALDVNRLANPLPSICSRVCHHPCEVKCRAGEIGEPIAIRDLKRFVTDYGKERRYTPSFKRGPKKDEKIAIIGSGPAGLMASWKLAQLGYDVTIFEAASVAGGMLAWGIPDYRLPKDILNFEINDIKEMGVDIRTNTTVGKDVSLDGLFNQGYKAIFIATGAPVNLKLGIPGEDVEGVIDPIEFLKNYNLNKKAKIGKKVAVVGGGNTAIDAARTAWRLGAEVTILYRRTRPEMPANKEDIEAAVEEGIKIDFLTLPVEVISKNGKLAGIKCTRMALENFDESGRRRPVPVEGTEYEIEIDTLMPAIGQEPDLSFLNGKSKLKISGWNTLGVDPETMATNVPGIFAGGDVVLGPATVLQAMQAGKNAAESIDRYLKGANLEREYEPLKPVMEVLPVELTEEEITEERGRPQMPSLSPKERAGNFKEVEAGISEEMAIQEARRCLRCDLEGKGGK